MKIIKDTEIYLSPQKDGYHLTENERITAQIKRVLEFCSMDAEFVSKLREEPGKALQDINVKIPFEKIKCLLMKDSEKIPLTEEAACYQQFVMNKLKSRNYMQQTGCTPIDLRFRRWRERQLNRCRVEMGIRNQVMIHAPLIFELSDGCSVGCPFCGVNAGKLKGIYRHTPENAELFREILRNMKTLLGDSAGSGTCYYATEPLDNPDYEKFIKDYYEILGAIPQLTTAAAMRDPERTRKMLSDFHSMYKHIHRFSVLNLETFNAIMDFFTPEELLYVELIPQFPQAPANHFSEAGRNRKENDESSYNVGTICCVSGLVVNMPRKEIRLLSPCGVDNEHPTGELLTAHGTFTDIKSFENMLREIMDKYMGKPDSTKPLSFYPYLDIEYIENGIIIKSRGGYENKLEYVNDASQNIPGITAKLIKEGGYCIEKIAEILDDEYHIDYAHSYYMLGKWYQSGFLTMET
ncbi:MAG: radical SAM family RiPP maturation amino acid epimerase [Lachnospiraceae bacterium]|nr:radical SAM family RiPP maturation amino acid epimerase [Lachnospiraceae bacterium]